MSGRLFECQHPIKGQSPRHKRANELPVDAQPTAAWFKSLSGEWQLQAVVDANDHPVWMDYCHQFTQATEVSK